MHELTPATRLARGRLHGADQHLRRVPLPHRRPGSGARRAAGSLKGPRMTTLPLTAGRLAAGAAAAEPGRVARRTAPGHAGRVDQARLVAFDPVDLARHRRRDAPRDVPGDPRRPAPFPRVVPGVRPHQPVPGRPGHRLPRPRRPRRPGHQRRVRHGDDPLVPGRHAAPRRAADGQGDPSSASAPWSSARRSASSLSSRARPSSRAARRRPRSANRACCGRWPCRAPSSRSSRCSGLGIGTVIRHTAGAIAVFAGVHLAGVPSCSTPSRTSIARFAPELIFANSVAAVVHAIELVVGHNRGRAHARLLRRHAGSGRRAAQPAGRMTPDEHEDSSVRVRIRGASCRSP